MCNLAKLFKKCIKFVIFIARWLGLYVIGLRVKPYGGHGDFTLAKGTFT